MPGWSRPARLSARCSVVTSAWQQPILRLADTVVGVVAAWTGILVESLLPGRSVSPDPGQGQDRFTRTGKGHVMDTAANATAGSVGGLFVHIVFASTSGHTEYVVDVLAGFLRGAFPRWEVQETMAEKTQPQDLLRGDILLLASGTWDTWSIEGQLNPYMWILLQDKAKNLDLAGKPCACIGLGDHRYFYTARAVDHLQRYVKAHHGRLILPALAIIDEPYGQEGTVRAWGEQLAEASKRIDRP